MEEKPWRKPGLKILFEKERKKKKEKRKKLRTINND